MKEFLTFQRFDDLAVAEDFIRFLEENGIKYEVEDDTVSYDATMGVERLTKDIRVKILQEDFERVNEMLLQRSAVDMETIDRTYHLFDFSDEELVEIISKPDEWSHYDYMLAVAIMKERGKEIHPELASVLRKNRVAELSKPETGTKVWIILGYVAVLLGGLLGVFIGIHMATHKKILPNGDKVFAFKESDRKHGFILMIVGIPWFSILLVLNVWMEVR